MQRVLQAFARIYQESASGRKGAARDHTIDYEKFLRAAGMADGDDRESAERELRAAEAISNGLFRIDRHKRSGVPERLRLARDGGERWLFERIGAIPPEEQRQQLAETFVAMAARTVPERWRQAWNAWFVRLSEAARNGGGIQPFRRDDTDGNRILTQALAGVLSWQGPALIRYASSAICGDSKQLQRLEPRLRVALNEITGSDSLEDFGILRKPRAVTLHGPVRLILGTSETDFSVFPGPVSLSETNLTPDARLTTTAPLCLTVENEDTFHELAATNPGVLLVLTSYAGSAVRRLLDLLPDGLSCRHFGDGDPAGSDILRDLREKTGRDIQALIIPGRSAGPRRNPDATQQRMLTRLLDADLPPSLRTHVETLLNQGVPADFEQESIPVRDVWATVMGHAVQIEKR